MTMSPKAKLLANNPGLRPDYLLDPFTDPEKLSEQLKSLSKEEPVASHLHQRVIDKMMPIVGMIENGHFVAVATCSTPGCDSESRWTCESPPKDHRVVFTKFRDRKWQASKRSLTCPKCVAKKKAPPVREFKREPDPPMKPIGEALRIAVDRASPGGDHSAEVHARVEDGKTIIDQITPTAEGETQVLDTTTAPTDKAKAAKRHAYSLLLEHYDEDGKRYNGDWSDRKIAGLVGMSETFVAKIREDDFGPAGPPPQLIDLKDRNTRLETKLREKERLVLQAMDEIPQMQEEVKLLQSQLASLIAAHGWSA